MSGVNEIRSAFLSYFANNGHKIVASSPLVPRNDPTLMFTNAGMNQFKNVFTGLEKRDYVTATTAQKVVRAGGKHNDLDNVGYTARHHTFFEMLGNFSFGDYFKERAIELAWNLITREFGLDKKRLLVTVYHEDEEAATLWKKIAGFSDDKIIRIPTSDNFWQMGDTGPCGPCSEIFYDQGEKVFGGPPGSADEDGDRFLEFWNLVFMQFEQVTGGERTNLPKPSIDTGMGLERIAAIMQGVVSNYDTDMMQSLIHAVAHATSTDPNGAQSASHRVIADHLRAASFLVSDGVLPSNEGRGYVLRRIMRRAMRHAELLGAREPLMWKLVPALTREMGQAYPELMRAEPMIVETLQLEETRFRRTLERGLVLLDEETKTLSSGGILKGETAFKLYDTYGFPLDLTQDALRSRGMSVDLAGFNSAMEKQKADARKAWAGSGEAATETVWFGVREQVGATEFLGYETEIAEGVVTAILKNGIAAHELNAGEEGIVILNQTPFYAESGGQVGDNGVLTANGIAFDVTDTLKKLGDVFAHVGKLQSGAIQIGTALQLQVNPQRRAAIKSNHSATHILHEALRLVLGDHVAQKGSSVDDARLRFDFSHQKPISDAEMEKIEDIANLIVLQNAPVVTRLMGQEDAIKSGARALFGEKYGDEVRVVSIGKIDSWGETDTGKSWSVELCGGTHAARTGDIGLITVMSEGGVASGVRRIEAVTGNAARLVLSEERKRLRELADVLKVPPAGALDKLNVVLEERKKFERELVAARRTLAINEADFNELTVNNDYIIVSVLINEIDLGLARDIAVVELQKRGSEAIFTFNTDPDGKSGLTVALSKRSMTANNASDLIKIGAAVMGGKGGGKPDLAQAGGLDISKMGEAIEAMKSALKNPV
jgi:alanyl-tRNA synthetase